MSAYSDGYCAVCSGPLDGANVHVGPSPDEGDTAEAHKAHDQSSGASDEGQSDGDGSDDASDQDQNEEDSQGPADTPNVWAMLRGRQDSPASIAEVQDEDCQYYDRTIIKPQDTRWMNRNLIVGFNDERSRPFFAKGRYQDSDYGYGDWHFDDSDQDNWEPRIYADTVDFKAPCFPFHRACYRLLSHRLAGHMDDPPDEYFLDALYRACTRLVVPGYAFPYPEMKVHRGPVGERLREDFWKTVPGEEMLVCDPTDRRGIAAFLRDKLGGGDDECFQRRATEVAALPAARATGSDGNNRDVFSRLPLETLVQVCDHLGADDLAALVAASWWVHCALRQQHGLFARILQGPDLGWFPELQALVGDHGFVSDNRDLYSVFRWAMSSTRARKGLRQPYARLANARRVWRALADFDGPFAEERAAQTMDWVPDDLDVEAGFRKARELARPPIRTKRIQRALWADRGYGYSDALGSGGKLRFYWEGKPRAFLQAISMEIDDDETIFGEPRVHESHAVDLVDLRGKWISQLTIYLSPVDEETGVPESPKKLPDEGDDLDDLRQNWLIPTGVTVVCTTGESFDFRRTDNSTEKIILKPAPEFFIIGLHGQSGVLRGVPVIANLGLIQTTEIDLDEIIESGDQQPDPEVD